MSYGTRRTKIEGGSGGRRGHSNMNHRVPTEEIKVAARKARRLEARQIERSELPVSGPPGADGGVPRSNDC